jgi:hypothetical protein
VQSENIDDDARKRSWKIVEETLSLADPAKKGQRELHELVSAMTVFIDDNSGSTRRDLVDAMIALIEAATEGRWKANLFFLAYILYSRAFTEEDEQNWLRDRFAPFRQIMKESSIFQEMLQRDLEASKN